MRTYLQIVRDYCSRIVLALCIGLLTTRASLAVYDPLSVPNNKYGIHIIDENDLEDAADLVNSSGGDWGYVTVVIPQNERNIDKWNSIFAKMRSLHLIPLVRIATTVENNMWKSPSPDDIPAWIDFLSRLEWVNSNRYIILFNEPNHAKEWGGRIDPVEYGSLVASFSAELKKSSNDFFILGAGLDASAPDGFGTMDEKKFLKTIKSLVPHYFDSIDGWNSHSYPNPGFSGNVNAYGRGTLRTYVWEKQFLQQLDVPTDYPIFITETGWVHAEGMKYDRRYYSADYIATLYNKASEFVWNDEKIVALTPFVLSYQGDPFTHFSWKKYNESDFYPQFDTYKSIPKIAGSPQLVPTFTPTPTISFPIVPTYTPQAKKNYFDLFSLRILSIYSFFVRAKT